MKKFVVAVCLFVSMIGFAQDEKMSKEDSEKMQKAMEMMFNSKIAMDIDTNLFSANEGNTYFTEDQSAGIIAMVVPQTYAKMKSKINDDPGKPGLKILDKGETTLGGQNVLFQKASKQQDGKDLIIYIYCKENDPESCMMITGVFEKAKEVEFTPHVHKAVASAKLTK